MTTSLHIFNCTIEEIVTWAEGPLVNIDRGIILRVFEDIRAGRQVCEYPDWIEVLTAADNRIELKLPKRNMVLAVYSRGRNCLEASYRRAPFTPID